MRRALGLLLVGLASVIQAQTVTVMSSHFTDSSGHALSGYVYFQPVNCIGGYPISYRMPGGGTVMSNPVQVVANNGALSLTLPDTTQTYPANICFTMTYPQGTLAVGYSTLQPHTTAYNSADWCQAGVCNLDNYMPGNQPLPTLNAVQSINYIAGPITFTGTGVSQVGNTFTFTVGGTFTAAGDLSGTSTSQEVVGLLSKPLPSLSAGYLNWTGTQWALSSVPSGFTAGGDLSGTSTSQQVVGLDDVPFCTGFTPGNGQSVTYTTGGTPNPCYGASGPSPVNDVRSFGAVCTNSVTGTSSTTAIQTAINSASCTLHNVYAPACPAGQFYLVSTLYFNYDAANNPGFCNPVTSTFTQGGGFKFYGDGNAVQALTPTTVTTGTNIVSTSTTVPALQMLYGVTWDGNTNDYPWQYSAMSIEDMNIYAANSSAVVWWQGNGVSNLKRLSVTQGGNGHGLVCENCYSGDEIEQIVANNSNASIVSGSTGIWIYNDLGGGGGTISIDNIVSGGGYDTCVKLGPSNQSGTNPTLYAHFNSIRASNLDGENCNTGILLSDVYGVELSGWHTERNHVTGMTLQGVHGASIHGGEARDCCSNVADIQIFGFLYFTSSGIDISGNRFELLSYNSTNSSYTPAINIIDYHSVWSSGSIHGNTFQPAPYSATNWGMGIQTNGNGQNWSVFNNAISTITSTVSPYPTITLAEFIDSSANLDFYIDPATDYVHIPKLILSTLDANGDPLTIGNNTSSNAISLLQVMALGNGGVLTCGSSTTATMCINQFTETIQAEYSPTVTSLGIGMQYGYFYHLSGGLKVNLSTSTELTGDHGIGIYVQHSDGTGTSHAAAYDADGNLTDGGVGEANHAVCWKTAGTLGYCSVVVDGSGVCGTCN